MNTTSQDLLRVLWGGKGTSRTIEFEEKAHPAQLAVNEASNNSNDTDNDNDSRTGNANTNGDVLGALFNSIRHSPAPSKNGGDPGQMHGQINGNSNKLSGTAPAPSSMLGGDGGKLLLAMLNQTPSQSPALGTAAATVKLEQLSSNGLGAEDTNSAYADAVHVEKIASGIASSSRDLEEEPVVATTSPSAPSPSIQAGKPQPSSQKQSPFTFFSPFDALDALTAKQRAASSPLVKPEAMSIGGLIKPTHNDQLLPKRQASLSQVGKRPLVTTPLESVPQTTTFESDPPQVTQIEAAYQAEQLPETMVEPVPNQDATLHQFGLEDNRQSEHPNSGITPQKQNGLLLLPDTSNSQKLSIDLSDRNEDLKTAFESEHQAISRFKSSPSYSRGRQIAVNGLISYATRAGRIRVIDPRTGARLIKKIHSTLATDMIISGVFQSDHSSNRSGLVRRLASCSPGRLAVWEIPAAFDADEVSSEIILDFTETQNSFAYLAFSPTDPNKLACATQANKIVLIDLKICGGTHSGRPADALLLANRSRTLKDDIAAMAFSADGSVIVMITEHNKIYFDSVHGIHCIGETQLGSTSPHKISDVALLQSTLQSDCPMGLALGRAEGNLIEIYSLKDLHQPASALQIVSTDKPNFGHLTYLPNRGALALSTSSRGSVFLITLDLSNIADGVPKESVSHFDNAEALVSLFKSHLLDSSTTSSSSPSSTAPLTYQARISHIVELPTSHTILQTVVSPLGQKDNLFYLHPDGFEQMTLDPEIFEAVVQQQRAALGRPDLHSENRKSSDRQQGEYLEDLQQVPEIAVESIETDKPKDLALQKSEGADQAETAPLSLSTDSLEGGDGNEDFEQQLSNMREADASPAPPFLRSEPEKDHPLPTTPLPAILPEPTVSEFDLKALFSEQAKVLESMLLSQQKADKADYEELSSLLSDMLSGTSDKRLETAMSLQQQVKETITKEIDELLLPEVLKAFSDLTRAVESAAESQAFAVKQTTMLQVKESVIESLSTHLPQHFENIARQVPAMVVPAVDSYVQRAFQPHFERLEGLIRATVSDQANTIDTIRQTMMTEQMRREENAVRLETELDNLRGEINDRFDRQAGQAQKQIKSLQTEMNQVKSLLSKLISSEGPVSTPVRPMPGSVSRPSSEKSVITGQPIPSNSSNLRPSTPLEMYEDMFLRTLKDDPSPLVKLIDEAPFHRMAAVLPSQGQPAISPPNVLALCLYIARDFPLGGPELGLIGKKRLAWLFSAVQATRFAKRDSRYASYLPRVYTDTLHGLSERRKALTNVEDIEAISAVLQAIDSISMER